jgi:hypothetical protein
MNAPMAILAAYGDEMTATDSFQSKGDRQSPQSRMRCVGIGKF